jgi:hypothetical protein
LPCQKKEQKTGSTPRATPTVIRRYAIQPAEIDGIESRTIAAKLVSKCAHSHRAHHIPAVSIFHVGTCGPAVGQVKSPKGRTMNNWSLHKGLAAALFCMIVSCSDRLRGDGSFDAKPLRAAIADLMTTFEDRYPQGHEYLKRLDRVKTVREFESLQREALLANPLVSGQPILYVVRSQYAPDHHNTETMFQTGEINTASFHGPGMLKTINPACADRASSPRQKGANDQKTEPVSPSGRTLLDLPEGVARDPDVSFDGRRIIFAMRRNREDDYHLYEINADGTKLKQLTFASGISDINPQYLPDGRVVFTSTREPKYCMCNRHIMGNLFTMDADGANIQQIGHGTLHEGHAALMPDGRIIYDRWEYVDRNFGNAQGLWTCNPDGTNHAIYYGNNTESPGAKLQGRPIPGTARVICTFSSCHDRPWGALAILDRRCGVEGRSPVVRTWPAIAIDLVGHGNFDAFSGVQPKYEDPYPLSDKYFLCSRMTGQEEQMGIYLLDAFGNEILLHVEGAGCFNPMPLRPRPTPPLIARRIDLAKREGSFYVWNVYEGTGMEQIPRGTIKWLRVVESPAKRFWTAPGWDGGTGQQAPGMAWNDFNNKRILGTAPVEADGSAYFNIPADTFVYFQLLDEKGMMIQSMRSGTIVRPGEQAGCIGCHESRQMSGPVRPNTGLSAALLRGPSRLASWYGRPRNFGYLAEVQSVFDKSCVSCHDYGKEAGAKLNLAGDLNACFNTSYVELRSKDYVRVIGAGPPEVQPPKSWGSHTSRLVKVLCEGHGNPEIDRQVKLDREGFDRIVTWIDLNAPYYPEYAGGAYGNNAYGRCPIDAGKLQRLQQLTAANTPQNAVSLLNFTRPERSACLAALDKNDSRYHEALQIIQAGKESLATNPRPDMPNFQNTDKVEIDRQAKYDAFRKADEEARAAIIAGKKKFDNH